MLYKDSINRKNGQKNLGVIKSSNLCSEIVEYTDPEETPCVIWRRSLYQSTCAMANSITALHNVTKMVTKNLNRVIDRNFYPTESARRSNMRHRPIGIGVQGLADTFLLCDLAFDSEEARDECLSLKPSTTGRSRPRKARAR